MARLVLFASGSGTNVENLIRYFKNHHMVEIISVCCNNPDAFVIQRAKKHQIPVFVFNRADLYSSNKVLQYLRSSKADWIILAGFLWLLPENIVREFEKRIVNIHPALLPGYGGKGMYGMRVHQAVIDAGEKESGITIHYVNTEYDKGDIIFQARCRIDAGETPETLAAKVHRLEYEHYPEIVEKLVMQE
jgi:phosphoribosylglycinamide formyltransferase-1